MLKYKKIKRAIKINFEPDLLMLPVLVNKAIATILLQDIFARF
jgi:hypothetical protein